MSRKAGLHVENYEVVSESVERETSDADNGLNKQQEKSEGLKMKGLALPFEKRSRNGVIYNRESVKKAASTLEGCSVLFNHNENNAIGHIEKVEVRDDGLYYEADLNPDLREVESLERGDIPHVSIQALIQETEKTETRGEVAVTEFLEMSAVTIPGFPSTDVETGEEAVMIEKLVTPQEQEEEETDQSESEEALIDHNFEFEPVPDQVLYDDKNKALLRAKSIGLEEAHRHVCDDKEMWMAGATHQEWRQAMRGELDNQESLDNSTSKEPFADYDDFDDCVNQNEDKDNPEGYCAAIKRNTETASKLSEAISDVDTTPTEEMAKIAGEVLEAIDNSEYDNDDCGTRVGLERANQLENREELSPDTINRMVSFFARHDGNQKVNDDVDSKWEDCGFVAWQLWGGDAGREWAERKQEEIKNAKKEILGDTPVTEQDKTEELNERVTEQLGEVDEDDFMGTVADMYEELDVSDAASMMDKFTFTGDPGPLLAQVADLADMTPAELVEAIEDNMEAMDEPEEDEDDDTEEEGDYSDDEEEEESKSSNKNESESNSSQQGNSMTEKPKEEMAQKIESQEEKIQKLEAAIEQLEGVEDSKQDTPVSSSESNDGPSLRPDVIKRLSRR